MIDIRKRQSLDVLLALLKLSIGHQPISLPQYINWKVIFNLSNQQGIASIILDGAEKMFRDNLNPKCPEIHSDLKLDWITLVHNYYEKNFLRYTAALVKLADFYAEHGYKLMLLKGYGLGLNYPRPNFRLCGDIDTWSFGRCKQIDDLISKELSIKIDYSHHHHTVYNWNETFIENHYDFVNVHYGHRNAELEEIFKGLAMDDSYYTTIEGRTVYLPSPNLNVLFLLRHTMLHFASTNMTIRQLLDWGFFIKRYHVDINWEWALDIIKHYNMTEFFDCMNALCVCDLGFDESNYPYIKKDLKFKERILFDTVYPEFIKIQPNGILAKYLFKWQRRKANAWKRELCYGDEGLKSFISSILSHIRKPKGF